MTDFVTSDPHLFHPLLANLRGYATPDEFNDAWVDAYNDAVRSQKDRVFILGDLTGGSLPATQRAINLLARLKGEKHLILGNHDACVDTGSLAVTKRGLVSVSDLLATDELLSVDDQFNSTWVRPSRIIRKAVSEDMVSLKGSHVDALMTRDHRVVYASFDKHGTPKWREAVAEKFAPNTKTGFITAGRGIRTSASVSNEDIRLTAWLLTDSHFDGRYWSFYQRKSKASRIRDLLPIGSYRENERDRDISTICGKALLETPETGHEFHIYAGPFNDHLSALVPRKYTLPEWVWSLSEEQVDLLIDEWVYTDGTKPTKGGRGRVIYCSNNGLRGSLMALMASNGYRVSETEYRPGHWRINGAKNRLVTAQSRIPVNSEYYSGDVWCVTVPTGRFFIARGGKLHLTGNCHPMYRDSHKRMAMYFPTFASVQLHARKSIGGTRVLLSHFPYQGGGDHTAEDRFNQWRLPDLGVPLIHGHTHSDILLSKTPKGTIQVNVAWEATCAALVAFEDLQWSVRSD